MPEGAKLVSQLDAVSSSLLAAGADADALADAVAIASNALSDASAASKLANDALGKGVSVYADLERAADQAAKAQEKAARLGVVPPEVAASVESITSALNAHVTALRKLESDAAAAKATEAALATTLANTKQVAAAGTAAIKERESAIRDAADEEKKALAAVESAANLHDRQLKKTAGALNALGGPFGKVGAWAIEARDNFGDMSATMGGAEAASLIAASGLASLALAIGAVVVAAVAGTLAIAAWAVGLANANRSAALTQAAVEALDPAVAALAPSFKSLTNETGLAAPELSKLVKTLSAAKVSAADMPAALRAAALAEAALGAGGSADFVQSLKDGKRAASDLSREMSGKLGPIVAKQLQGLDAQSAKLKGNVGSLFGGLNIDPVLTGLARLVNLFDENTEAGAAIKTVFEGVFQPLIDSADKASVVAEAFVLGVLIGATKLYIALKPAIKTLSDFFGFDDPASADTMALVSAAGEALVLVLGGIVAAVTAVVAVLGLVALSFALPLIAATALVAGLVYAGVQIYDAISGAWQSATDYLNSITLEGVGTAIMQGLANGISAAAALPLQAITGVVGGVVDAAHSLLKINSPSKVFAAIGNSTGEGFALGVDEGAPEVQDAMIDMVDPTAAASSASAAPRGGGGGASPSGGGNFAGATLNFTLNGVKDGEHAVEMIREEVMRLFEGLADSISGPEGATT